MKVSSNFQLQEFVNPSIFETVGSRSLDFLHPLLIPTAQRLRDQFGEITINDWMWAGAYVDSGLRLPHGMVGTVYSAHKFGCAIDCKFRDVEPIEVQSYIILHQNEFPAISRIESALITKTWAHIEIGSRSESIHVFNP